MLNSLFISALYPHRRVQWFRILMQVSSNATLLEAPSRCFLMLFSRTKGSTAPHASTPTVDLGYSRVSLENSSVIS